MSNTIFVFNGVVPVGKASTTSAANAIARECGGGTEIARIDSVHALAAAFSEPSLRRIRAALKLRAEGTIVTPELIKHELAYDEVLMKRDKNHTRAAETCWSELVTQTWQLDVYDDPTSRGGKPARVIRGATAAESAERINPEDLPKENPVTKTTKAPRIPGGAKAYIRGLFPNIGDSASIDQMTNDGAFTVGAVTTAVSDLKNAKYAAGEVLVIERVKVEGSEEVRYERTA